jgi:O-succinylbenzoic acid--CoA ligase
MIDWTTKQSHSFINPRIPDKDRPVLGELQDQLKGHIFLTTSGTERLKWVALSKEAFLVSAEAVNRHLEARASDIWINALPYFHVGGLSIYARAFLSRSHVSRYDHKWDPKAWATLVQEKRGSLASLVPTQLWDLVNQKIEPIASLRALLIGGAPLSPELYSRAKEAGWPLMPTYGMTEMCSQIATATLDTPELKLLPHVEAKISPSGRLILKSAALLTGYLTPEFSDPKVEGWFETEDRVALSNGLLTPLGRTRDVIKIQGELVNLYQLERLLDQLKERLGISAETALVAKPDDRAGFHIHLYHTPYEIAPLIDLYNAQVAPFSRIKEAKELPEFPKTPLGKIKL